MTEKERLIELLAPTSLDFEQAVELADYLIANGVKLSATPRDFCAYDTPSSLDEKPCTMCPALKKKEG